MSLLGTSPFLNDRLIIWVIGSATVSLFSFNTFGFILSSPADFSSFGFVISLIVSSLFTGSKKKDRVIHFYVVLVITVVWKLCSQCPSNLVEVVIHCIALVLHCSSEFTWVNYIPYSCPKLFQAIFTFLYQVDVVCFFCCSKARSEDVSVLFIFSFVIVGWS